MRQYHINDNRFAVRGLAFRIAVFSCFLLVWAGGGESKAENWPTYRSDIARSGVGSETVGPELFLRWKYVPTHRPMPAWPMPAEEMPRMHVDNALRVAAADGRVYFGCPVTNQVYALDAALGKICWRFFAEGPVRFAPTFDNGRIYFGSDDGFAYCLNAQNGSLVWKYRAGPSNEKVIGNGRMISLWPIRTGVLVDDGAVYFAAGVFPYEGLYLCALRAADGSVIWKNDTVADRVYELEFGGISPHGYLVASKDVLYVPSGRAMPAGFDRQTGKFLFYASPGGHRGGTWALLDDDRLIAGVVYSESQGMKENPIKVAYDAKTGRRRGNAFAWFPGIDMVLTHNTSYVLTQQGIYAINRAGYAEAMKKAGQLAKERKALAKELAKLRTNLSDSVESDEKISPQIDGITSRLTVINKEEGVLKKSCLRWSYAGKGFASLIMAGDLLYAGGEGVVVGIDAKTGKQLRRETVVGNAIGLAASDGRLIVSTDKGPIYCFGGEKISAVAEIKTNLITNPYPNDKYAKIYRDAARAILKKSDINKGYCLIPDCNIGRLAYELAQNSELKIIGLEKDPRKLAIARHKLEAAGLLGKRVVVESWDIADLPLYFANLVVSDEAILSGSRKSREYVSRVLRPCGGVFMTCGLPGRDEQNERDWNKYVRPELKGAGSWTQLYANPQNSACSGDTLVKGPLGVLWFGEPGPQGMVERHSRTDSPLSINGRLFIQGEELVMAYDAYNGTFLWETKLPGAVRARVDVDGGNLSLTEDSLYVAAKDVCYRLDNVTGQIIGKYNMPATTDGSYRRWGYISCVKNMLLGVRSLSLRQEYAAKYKAEESPASLAVLRGRHRAGTHWRSITEFPSWGSQDSPKKALTSKIMTGDAVFALDVDTAKPLWVYHGKGIPNITVTAADDTVFFVEGSPTSAQRATALNERKRLVSRGIYKQGTEAEPGPNETDVRLIVALDAATGEIRWKRPLDLTGCGGDKMGSAYADGLLLFFGHFSNHDQKYFLNNKLTWRRITALDAQTGKVVWSRPLNYLRRPLIVGDKIIIEPRACNLRTGEIITRRHPVTDEQVSWEFLRPGHSCGITSASADTLFYRSYCGAIYEMNEDKGINLFGAVRMGCWLDIIAANGLMLMPEASSGCTCSYPLRCSVALVNKPEKTMGNWSVFISGGDMTPVKHLAVNLGAPGDMKDERGILWLGYPRIRKTHSVYNANPKYGVRFDLQEKLASEGEFFCKDYKGVKIDDTDKAWLFTSGCRGLLRCELPLIDEKSGQKPAVYTVRLGFTAIPDDRPGQRVFDIMLQGNVVLSNFDIMRTAQRADRAVIREFKAVPVNNVLVLELVPKTNNPTVDEVPTINFIEVVREN
jgi:outer membrane protein assembly factor BamB